MPTARLCLLADVAAPIPPDCWMAERLAREPAAMAGESVLYITGDLILPALHLNTPLNAVLPGHQEDGTKAAPPQGPHLVFITGHLHITGALTSDPVGPASDTPAHLIVLGDVHAGNVVLSGSQVHVQGTLQVDDLLWSHGESARTTTTTTTSNCGSSAASTLRVMGDVKARVALFTGNTPPHINGAEQVEFLLDGVRPVPHRAEFSSEIMGAVFAPAFHSGIHDGERGDHTLAAMLNRDRVVASVRAGQNAACSSADIRAAQPLADDLCAGDAITVDNILALLRSPVIAHKEYKAAGWFGQTDFALCRRHIDEEGDARDDNVFITVWKTWDFYLAVENEPGARGPVQKLSKLLGRKAQPKPPQLTLIYRRYANGQPGDWQALGRPAMGTSAQKSAPATDTHTAVDMDAWRACQQAWRGVLDYVRKAVGQHRARYPLHQRLRNELTATAIEDFTSLPVFTERYNNWWDSDHNGWWEGDLWVGARQPCMHNGEPWGRVLKLSWKNGDDAPGDDADNSHSAYQLDVDEARSGPPMVEVSYTQRQNEARTALPHGAADHIARLLRLYAAANASIRARDAKNRASGHA